MFMRVHGGWCCGITHIMSLGNFPQSAMGPQTKIPDNEWFEYQKANMHLYGTWNIARPAETAEERFRYLVSNQQSFTGRTRGIIEVVVTVSQAENGWRSLLEELGFKEVNSHVNSNSGRTLFVFHLNTGAE